MRYRLLLLPALILLLSAATETRRGEAQPPSALISLSSWNTVLFGRWIAIDATVRQYGNRYGIPVQWTMQTFASESVMDPRSQGLQPDDRGIGQVGYLAEDYGRRRGTDPNNRDYTPGLIPGSSIWNAQTNIILAMIWYRWVYDQPYVTSPQKAYAVSTYGPSAILSNGQIRWDAQQRVDRAAGFGSLISSFQYAIDTSRNYSWAQLVNAVPDSLTRDLIYINGHSTEGSDVYAQIYQRYLREVQNTGSAWTVLMFGREALTYLDELRWGYGWAPNYQNLVSALVSKRGLFYSGDLLNRYNALLADARAR